MIGDEEPGAIFIEPSLEDEIEDRGARRAWLEKYPNNDFVFATEIGTPILPSNLTRRHFKPILKKAELSEDIRLYDLRHTCCRK